MQSADRVAQDLKELNIKVCFEAVMYKTLEPTVLSSHPPMAIRLFPRTAALPKSGYCANKDVPEQIFRDACATALIGKKIASSSVTDKSYGISVTHSLSLLPQAIYSCLQIVKCSVQFPIAEALANILSMSTIPYRAKQIEQFTY